MDCKYPNFYFTSKTFFIPLLKLTFFHAFLVTELVTFAGNFELIT